MNLTMEVRILLFLRLSINFAVTAFGKAPLTSRKSTDTTLLFLQAAHIWVDQVLDGIYCRPSWVAADALTVSLPTGTQTKPNNLEMPALPRSRPTDNEMCDSHMTEVN